MPFVTLSGRVPQAPAFSSEMALPTRLLGALRLVRRPGGLGTAVARGAGVQLTRTGELSTSYAGCRPREFSSHRREYA